MKNKVAIIYPDYVQPYFRFEYFKRRYGLYENRDKDEIMDIYVKKTAKYDNLEDKYGRRTFKNYFKNKGYNSIEYCSPSSGACLWIDVYDDNGNQIKDIIIHISVNEGNAKYIGCKRTKYSNLCRLARKFSRRRRETQILIINIYEDGAYIADTSKTPYIEDERGIVFRPGDCEKISLEELDFNYI